MAQRVRWRLKACSSTTPQGFHRSRLTISGAMSANALTRQYPATQDLFDQLQIDRRFEGYESVEELAWRHGMDVAQFLEQLQQEAMRSVFKSKNSKTEEENEEI